MLLNALNKKFFRRKARIVAKDLIGKVVSYNNMQGIITETEAYEDDEASHAFKKTKRSELMYNTYGNFYIYFIYGNYYCLNITCYEKGPGAVLIRALKPLKNIELMKRGDLNGPGKLCQALSITKDLNGSELNEKIKIFDSNYKFKIKRGPRIGIQKAANLKWRFFI